MPSGSRLRGQDAQAAGRRAAASSASCGAGVEQVLAVVEHQQQLSFAQSSRSSAVSSGRPGSSRTSRAPRRPPARPAPGRPAAPARPARRRRDNSSSTAPATCKRQAGLAAAARRRSASAGAPRPAAPRPRPARARGRRSWSARRQVVLLGRWRALLDCLGASRRQARRRARVSARRGQPKERRPLVGRNLQMLGQQRGDLG